MRDCFIGTLSPSDTYGAAPARTNVRGANAEASAVVEKMTKNESFMANE